MLDVLPSSPDTTMAERRSSDAPRYPALVHFQPEPKWQRLLVPVLTEPELAGDGPRDRGWADGARLIDRHRQCFRLRRSGDTYDWTPLEDVVDDAALIELMLRNLDSLGRPRDVFEKQTESLEGEDLFGATIAYAGNLPKMRTALQVAGCLVLIVGLVLVAAIPAFLLGLIP